MAGISPHLGLPSLEEVQHTVGMDRALDSIFGDLDGLFGEETIPYAAEVTAFQKATTADITLEGNCTIFFTPNPVPGLLYKLFVVQPATGGPFTVAWGNPIRWAGGNPPTLSELPGAASLIVCQYVNPTLGWYCKIERPSSYRVVTSNCTAEPDDVLFCDTSGGAFTVTFPANPEIGCRVVLSDAKGTWGDYNLTLVTNGININDNPTPFTIVNSSGDFTYFVYCGATLGWRSVGIW